MTTTFFPCPKTPREFLFWEKVCYVGAQPDDCWMWEANVVGSYGQFWAPEFYGANGRGPSHRFAYANARGPIPAGMDIDHLCRVRLCQNPRHMEPVTRQVNVLRGGGLAAINATKVACDNGHPFDDENVLLTRGERVCRECARERTRRWRARMKV
jgi:hypothetical protein